MTGQSSKIWYLLATNSFDTWTIDLKCAQNPYYPQHLIQSEATIAATLKTAMILVVFVERANAV
jgi:hypothetical protein